MVLGDPPRPNPVWPLPERLGPMVREPGFPIGRQGLATGPRLPEARTLETRAASLSLCFSPGKEVFGRMESKIKRKD